MRAASVAAVSIFVLAGQLNIDVNRVAAVAQSGMPGWELPSEADWLVLAAAFGGHYELAERQDIGDPRASYATLLEGGSSGFAARLGGSRNLETGKSIDLEEDGSYWSGSSCGAERISSMVFNEHNRRLLRDCDTPTFANSVRCIRSGDAVAPDSRMEPTRPEPSQHAAHSQR